MKKIFTSLLIIMLLLIFGVGVISTKSLSPYKQARNETIEIVNRRADFNIVKDKDFYWYNGDETYFTITGETEDGESMIAIVEQKSGKIESYKQEDIIAKQDIINQTYDEINPQKIFSIQIGINDSIPVWEVSFRQESGQIGYILYSLTSGEWIKTIKNI